MRPGQLTPENFRPRRDEGQRFIASMRPGQLTPENVAAFLEQQLGDVASMRPGQLTPENDRRGETPTRLPSSFNEAGAINPGKQHGGTIKGKGNSLLQ